MSNYHYYHVDTGVIHEKTVSSDLGDEAAQRRFAAANAPEGHAAIAGHFNRATHKINISTATAEAYQPEPPSALDQRRVARTTAQTRVSNLELQAQRALRETVLALAERLGVPADRLKELDTDIAVARKDLR